MSKGSFHPRRGAEALNQLCTLETRNALLVVVRLALVVLISIVITHFQAEPV